MKIKQRNSAKKRSNTTRTGHNNPNQQKPYMVIPYYRGLSESLKKICSRHGVQVYCKGGNTIKNLLMAPKDKDPIMRKNGVIYRYRCNRVDCDEEYIGESSRVFGDRFKEHQKAPSPILTILPSLVMTSVLTTLALWGGKTRTSIELSKKLYLLGSIIHP